MIIANVCLLQMRISFVFLSQESHYIALVCLELTRLVAGLELRDPLTFTSVVLNLLNAETL